MTKRLIAFTFAALPLAAFAQVIVIGPFTGAMQDSYETQPAHQFLSSYDIFGGTGSVDQIGAGQGVHITTGWSFFSTIFPHGGARFLGGAGVNYEFNFDTPAFQFGGYFGTNADAPDAVATFFDAANVQIGSSLVVSAPMGGQWAWNGWEYGAGIKRITIVANNQWGGFIMSDDIEYNAVPEPAAIVALALGLFVLGARRRR